jgi:hypothetical protein
MLSEAPPWKPLFAHPADVEPSPHTPPKSKPNSLNAWGPSWVAPSQGRAFASGSMPMAGLLAIAPQSEPFRAPHPCSRPDPVLLPGCRQIHRGACVPSHEISRGDHADQEIDRIDWILQHWESQKNTEKPAIRANEGAAM